MLLVTATAEPTTFRTLVMVTTADHNTFPSETIQGPFPPSTPTY